MARKNAVATKSGIAKPKSRKQSINSDTNKNKRIQLTRLVNANKKTKDKVGTLKTTLEKLSFFRSGVADLKSTPPSQLQEGDAKIINNLPQVENLDSIITFADGELKKVEILQPLIERGILSLKENRSIDASKLNPSQIGALTELVEQSKEYFSYLSQGLISIKSILEQVEMTFSSLRMLLLLIDDIVSEINIDEANSQENSCCPA